MRQLRVAPVALQAMAARWGTSAGELSETAAPPRLGLPSQASTAAVDAAHADITAFTAALATRVDARATRVTEADTRYISTEADSVNTLAAVVDPVTGV
jgi:hypothetical protein